MQKKIFIHPQKWTSMSKPAFFGFSPSILHAITVVAFESSNIGSSTNCIAGIKHGVVPVIDVARGPSTSCTYDPTQMRLFFARIMKPSVLTTIVMVALNPRNILIVWTLKP